METPQGEERERRTEEILETMTGNFRQLMSDIKPQRINAKKKKKQTNPAYRAFPGGPVVKKPPSSEGLQVSSLVGEPRSHTPQGS